MIPVLGAAAIREVDRATLTREGIASIALMERAAMACTSHLLALNGRIGNVPFNRSVVVAGMGNNGGDGLAIARMLQAQGKSVRVLYVEHRDDPSADNAGNLSEIATLGIAVERIGANAAITFGSDELIIDALFGTGLSAPLTGVAKTTVQAMNCSGRPIVSIDMPSGLFAEKNAANDGEAIVRASITLSFEVPKLSFFLADNGACVGQWHLLDIGLDKDAIAQQPTAYRMVETADVRAMLKQRARFAHKGVFGHALIIAGSEGMMGAGVLATKAALRSGVGLVTAHIPRCGLSVVQTAAPEAMVNVDAHDEHVTGLPDLAPYRAVAVGPGMRVQPVSRHLVEQLLRSTSTPLVLDADALNALAGHFDALAPLGEHVVLTPHPGEFDRMIGEPSTSSFDRLNKARERAQRWQCYILLKGAWTAICGPNDKVYFNPTGNPGMAKGGSGDALTGLLVGLLAQGYAVREACIIATYVHGLAGDIAAQDIGMDGMTAMDTVNAIPAAWRALREGSEH